MRPRPRLLACALGLCATVAALPARAELKTVLVVGGGYGGLAAAEKLSAHKDVKVVLVDREPTHAAITDLPDHVARGKDVEYSFEKIASAKGFTFRQGEVARWDAQKKQVELRDGTKLGYDAIVVGVGGKATTPGNTPGAKENAYQLRTMQDARVLRGAIQDKLKQAQAGGPGEKKMRVVVVGAGATGIELAGSLRRSLPPWAQVTLMQRSGKISPLPDTTPREQRYTERALAGLGVEVWKNTAPVRYDRGAIHVSEEAPGGAKTERRVEADIVVSTIGGAGAGAELAGGGDKQGRIPVNAALQREGAHGAYVIGDAAAARDPRSGEPVAMTAQLAVQQGKLAAANILRGFQGKPPLSYQPRSLGVLTSIGPRTAIGRVLGVPVRGPLASVLKATVTRVHGFGLPSARIGASAGAGRPAVPGPGPNGTVLSKIQSGEIRLAAPASPLDPSAFALRQAFAPRWLGGGGGSNAPGGGAGRTGPGASGRPGR